MKQIIRHLSTIVFSFHFSRFPTVEYIPKGLSFLSMTSKLFKKVPVEKESSHSMGGTILFLALFAQNYILGQQHNLSQSCDTVRCINLIQKCWRQQHNVLGTKMH